jgi:hypothetical protein
MPGRPRGLGAAAAVVRPGDAPAAPHAGAAGRIPRLA